MSGLAGVGDSVTRYSAAGAGVAEPDGLPERVRRRRRRGALPSPEPLWVPELWVPELWVSEPWVLAPPERWPPER